MEFRFNSGNNRVRIENVTTFYDFRKALMLHGLWNEVFIEFRDNGLSGCSPVVGADSRKWGHVWTCFCERTGPDRLVGPFQKILAEDHMYYNHYAIESAFKKAMNLDTMAVVHFAVSACK